MSEVLVRFNGSKCYLYSEKLEVKCQHLTFHFNNYKSLLYKKQNYSISLPITKNIH